MSDKLRSSLHGPTTRNVGYLILLVAGALFAVRLWGALGSLGRVSGNVGALRAAMNESPLLADRIELLGPVPDTASGLQARARASVLADMGDYSRAEEWLVAGLNDVSSIDLTQFHLCRLYWEIGLRPQALQVCQGTVVSAGYWLGAGIRALDRGDAEEALKLFEMAAYVSPDSAEGWRRYGQALLDGGRPEEAVAALERVLFLTSSPEADVYGSLANAYLAVENLTMARDVLNVGLLSFPEQRDYYRAMAESFVAEGDIKTADSWYVRMLQRWPYDAAVWAERGSIALEDGRLADAVSFYEQAATNSPDGFGNWMNLASAAAMANDPALVLRATDRALALRPDEPAAWLQAGRLLSETGQTEAAREAFERVLILQPDNQEAVIELAAQREPEAP